MPGKILATIDLGSNSFHMLITRVDQTGKVVETIAKQKYKVQLRSGLKEHRIDEATSERALNALRAFAKVISRHHVNCISAVGTFTLRQINPNDPFLHEASNALGAPINIVSGEGEAMLIYKGVTSVHNLSGSTLMVDIGGGSTEMILADETGVHSLCSMPMGCVSFQNQFFDQHALSKQSFTQAHEAAMAIIAPRATEFKKQGWAQVYGSSGTIQTVGNVIAEFKLGMSTLTLDQCVQLRTHLIYCREMKNVKLAGLRADRHSILPGGLAILIALYQVMGFDQLIPTVCALREGLLQELIKRELG